MTEVKAAIEAQCMGCGSTGGVAKPVAIPLPEGDATIRVCLACRTRMAAGEFYKLGGVTVGKEA